MDSKLKKLRETFAKEEDHLRAASGKPARFSEAGPVSLALVKAVIELVEEQAREIEDLKKRAGAGIVTPRQ